MEQDTMTRLDRTKGRLTNRATVFVEGQKCFVCDCRCGRTGVIVPARAFNDGKETGCPECKAAGLAPYQYADTLPRRISLSLDADVMATLGFDAATVGPAFLRTLLREVANAVRDAAQTLTLTPAQWRRLGEVASKHPDVMEATGGSGAKVGLLMGQAGLTVPLTPLQAVAVLSALRWRESHPEGNWWDVDQRSE